MLQNSHQWPSVRFSANVKNAGGITLAAIESLAFSSSKLNFLAITKVTHCPQSFHEFQHLAKIPAIDQAKRLIKFITVIIISLS